MSTPGLPTREEVEGLGSPLARVAEVHEEISSTQARARELARSGAQHGTLVVSGVQKGGRGRLGRAWGSPAGGLWASFVLRPDWGPQVAPRITQTAAVAVAKSLRAFGVEARIKWPNDLIAPGGKVCGILAESSLENVPVAAKRVGPAREGAGGLRLDFVVLGLGINANLDPDELGVTDRSVSTVRAEIGRDVPLLELLSCVLGDLDRELDRIEDFRAVLEDWRELDCTLGNRVRVLRYGETLEGEAMDLNADGALVLRTPGGTVEVYEGEVERLRGAG